MDFFEHWKTFLREAQDVIGGALFTTDGTLITAYAFGDNEKFLAAACAAYMALGNELLQDTHQGELGYGVLSGEFGYVMLLPVAYTAIFAVLARKEAKLGLVWLDAGRAIAHGPFGPGMAADLISIVRPPRRAGAHAVPEED